MMKWVADSLSKYGCQLHCSGFDIDEAMEERFLKFYNGVCDIDQPALDIERFIDEGLQKDRIEFDPEAGDLPKDVLGATQFNQDGSRLIKINAGLYRQRNLPAQRGRYRFTCAHESFHALFHSKLFQKGGRLICSIHHIREDMVESISGHSDFTEWQANRGAAALLMPRTIFEENVNRIRSTSAGMVLGNLIVGLSTRFDVSKQSVRIRLQTLRLFSSPERDFVLEHDGIDSYVDERKR